MVTVTENGNTLGYFSLLKHSNNLYKNPDVLWNGIVSNSNHGSVTVDNNIVITKTNATNTDTVYAYAMTAEKIYVPEGVTKLNVKIADSTIYVRFGLSDKVITSWPYFIKGSGRIEVGNTGVYSLDVSDYAGTGVPYYIVIGTGFNNATGYSSVSEVWFS